MIEDTLVESTPSSTVGGPSARDERCNSAGDPETNPLPDNLDHNLLLRQVLDPDLSPLDLCDIHDVSLKQLDRWLNWPSIREALRLQDRIERRRRIHIARRSRTTALGALERLATSAPAGSMKPAEQIRCSEIQRKSAAHLTRMLGPTSGIATKSRRATNRADNHPSAPARQTAANQISNPTPQRFVPTDPNCADTRATNRAKSPPSPQPDQPPANQSAASNTTPRSTPLPARPSPTPSEQSGPSPRQFRNDHGPPPNPGVAFPSSHPPNSQGILGPHNPSEIPGTRSQRMTRFGCATLALAAGAAMAQRALPDFEAFDDNHIIAGSVLYESWEQYVSSDHFRANELRCAFHAEANILDGAGAGDIGPAGPEDCTYNFTNPAGEYDPSTGKFRIPVVVHVIQRTNGTGFIPEDRVRSQIDVLNEDFQAILGSNGENGTDIQIEFFLATEDPDGNPTSGITYSTNDTWYNDSGRYYDTLHWDTNRYCNIYTNSASGALGYVPDLPQGGIAGQPRDRIVVLHSAFGRNSPLPPFHLGRTATHEMGHYLGLWHTFDNGCGTQNCYSTGDRICDTNSESGPVFGCPGNSTTCGTPDPFHNYMDYSDDICMDNFTPEQARRIRCSLEHYRPNLAQTDSGCPADIDGNGVLDADDFFGYLDLFANEDPDADLTGNGVIDSNDFFAYLDLFATGC